MTKNIDSDIFTMTFETERLLCRPTQIEDAAFVLELMNTEQ